MGPLALMGPGPLCAPWDLMGPGPLWAMGPYGPPWALMGPIEGYSIYWIPAYPDVTLFILREHTLNGTWPYI